LPSEPRQQRRRVDRAQPARSPVERVLFGLGIAAALIGLGFGAWWLWDQMGVGVPVRDNSPNWTPAGDVVFASESDGKSDIVVTDRSGGHRRAPIQKLGDNGGPAFSLDGTQLAFHSDRDGNYEIYVAQADGLAARRITNDPAIDQMPAWSRDGTQIVFMSNRADGKHFDIYRMNKDGSNVERLTTGGSNWFPEYSPDGGQLALHIERDIYIMSLATKGLRRLTRDPVNGMHPTWSPDGRRLAVMTFRNGRGEIFTSNVDGSNPKVLVTMPTGDAIDPRWSPDGHYIAFVHVPDGVNSAGDSGQRIVYVVDEESGRLQRVSR
jgi:Tol biopolymer transport system component